MTINTTNIEGLIIIEPLLHKDERGYFFESYQKKNMSEQNINFEFVQDNQAKSSYGVIRGLHYQLAPYAQTKLIRVLQGRIFDVAVDIRIKSPTFGKWYGIELNDENNKQLLIPKGFAHGYSVLSDIAVVMYKCDEYYNKASERGINCRDTDLGIDWQIDAAKKIISPKDKVLPFLKNAEINFYNK